MKRSHPAIALSCIGVGIAALAVSAVGNFRFGWSLGLDPGDQWWHAGVYAGADVAAAVLIAAGSAMLAMRGWRWAVGGTCAVAVALILAALSVVSTFGVMSGRIANLAGQKTALQVDMERLHWLRGQTMIKDQANGQRQAFLAEERKASKDARDAASVVPDKQAVGLSNAAAMFGFKVSTEQAQVGLTVVSAMLPMTVKFVCLGIGFFLWGSRLNETAGTSGKSDAETAETDNPDPIPRWRRRLWATLGRPHPEHLPASIYQIPKEELIARCKVELRKGLNTTPYRQIAKETGWSPAQISREMTKLRSRLPTPSERLANGNGAAFNGELTAH